MVKFLSLERREYVLIWPLSGDSVVITTHSRHSAPPDLSVSQIVNATDVLIAEHSENRSACRPLLPRIIIINQSGAFPETAHLYELQKCIFAVGMTGNAQ